MSKPSHFIPRHPREMTDPPEHPPEEEEEEEEEVDQPYACPAPGCTKVYTCYGSLYQHKRAHHPELMTQALIGQSCGRGRPR